MINVCSSEEEGIYTFFSRENNSSLKTQMKTNGFIITSPVTSKLVNLHSDINRLSKTSERL